MKETIENFKPRIVRKGKLFTKLVFSIIKWGFCSVITGIVCGLIGSAFYYCVNTATAVRTSHTWIISLLPLAGLLIVFLYRQTHMLDDGGTNRVIKSIRTEKPLPFRMAPLIFISTVITHLFGGSSGREGAALQIGGSIGFTLGKGMRLSSKDLHIITMCGMSGVFSALFGTPITATIFSMEVISVGVLYYVAFIPCLCSSVIAYHIAAHFGIMPKTYILTNIPKVTTLRVIQVGSLAAFCAMVSVLFCVVIHKTHSLYKKKIKQPFVRAFVGGTLVIILTLLLQTYDYNGAGMDVVLRALEGKAIFPAAFLFKILFTAITLGAGFKGGEIVPSFFIGATFGSVVGTLLGLPAGFAAAIGLIAVFCGVVNCPIASLFLSIELFQGEGLVLFAFACAVSYVLSGYYSLYHSQKIVYSKIEPTYINKNTY